MATQYIAIRLQKKKEKNGNRREVFYIISTSTGALCHAEPGGNAEDKKDAQDKHKGLVFGPVFLVSASYYRDVMVNNGLIDHLNDEDRGHYPRTKGG